MTMRRIGLIPLLLGLLSGVPEAVATDWYTGAQATAVAAPPSQFGVAIDTAFTADTQGSRYGTLIGTIAPFSGLTQSGFRLRLGGVLGQYSYVASAAVGRVQGTQEDGSFLVGYEWVARRFTVAAYAGGDYNNNSLNKYDPNNTAQGSVAGVKVAVDFNYRPTDDTMISGTSSYSTAHNSYYVRLKGGWALVPQLYVGPEILFLGDNFFRQYRIGAHITGARVGLLQFGVSAGFLNDKTRGNGGYGIIDSRLAF
jgi:hypothetical protein